MTMCKKNLKKQVYKKVGGSSDSLVSNMLNCDIVVSEFKLQSQCCVHFQTNILGKGMNLLILSSNELNNTITVLLQGWL